MMTAAEVGGIVKARMPEAQVQAEDMTGTGDHFEILVVSPAFRGKTLIDQHKMVQAALAGAMDDGRIHAVHIKTETPESWEKKRGQQGDLNIIQ